MNQTAQETIATPSQAESPVSYERSGVRGLTMIFSAVLAASLCYATVGFIGKVYPTPPELLNLGASPTDAERAAAMSAKLAADSGNATAWMGLTGAILGAVFALTIGWLRRAGARTALGIIAGIVAAGGLGCVAGNYAVAYHNGLTANMLGGTSTAEPQLMMMHGVSWGLIGLGVGLACGLSNPTIELKSVFVSMMIAGVTGGLAGVAFPLVAAVFTPLTDSSLPFPQRGPGLVIWMGLASVLIAAGQSRSS